MKINNESLWFLMFDVPSSQLEISFSLNLDIFTLKAFLLGMSTPPRILVVVSTANFYINHDLHG
jgi:hypothetical protein